MQNCKNCGIENSDSAKFCKGCGTSINNEVTMHNPVLKDSKDVIPETKPQNEYKDISKIFYLISFVAFFIKSFPGILTFLSRINLIIYSEDLYMVLNHEVSLCIYVVVDLVFLLSSIMVIVTKATNLKYGKKIRNQYSVYCPKCNEYTFHNKYSVCDSCDYDIRIYSIITIIYYSLALAFWCCGLVYIIVYMDFEAPYLTTNEWFNEWFNEYCHNSYFYYFLRRYFATSYYSLGSLIPMLISLCSALFFYPTRLARRTEHNSSKLIFVLNLLLGWTVIMWVILLIWANLGANRQSEEKKVKNQGKSIIIIGILVLVITITLCVIFAIFRYYANESYHYSERYITRHPLDSWGYSRAEQYLEEMEHYSSLSTTTGIVGGIFSAVFILVGCIRLNSKPKVVTQVVQQSSHTLSEPPKTTQEKFEELQQLLLKGIITQQEYDEKRKEILSKI